MRLFKRFKSVSTGLAALALFGTASAADPLTTKTPSFRIPFAVEAANGVEGGKAILFAGRDGGPLEVLQRVDATAGGFEFSAPTDGLYAFAVRMTDPAGQVVGGEGKIEPELEVVVDTTAPELQFQLAEATPGSVTISWKCSESEIAPESLRLEYAEGSDGRWAPITVESSSAGQTTIESKPGNSISVRGMITDLAGNRGSGSGQIVLSATQNSFANNSAVATNDALTVPGAAQGNQSLGANPFYGGSPQSPVSSQAATAYNIAPPTQQPAMPVASYPQQTYQPMPQPQPSAPQQYQANYGHYSAASYTPDVRTSQSSTGGQIVNNRVFDINYEVNDVGPSGVSTVKLFVTENNGQNWFSYGDDVDMRSPFQVDTRGEGTFGFAVRVRNGLGFSDPPPQPGELPSIVVTVDQTPPVANFAQPQIIADGQGRIRLKWNTTDPHPSSTPVRLEYAMSASGPWTPIFDWQADVGGHEMSIQPGMPNTIYYRLLARDAAGNVTTAQAPHPLMIDQHRPTVKLLSIQPVSSAVNRGF